MEPKTREPRQVAGHSVFDQLLAGVGIEAELQELQSVVVVLPEEVLQTRGEQAHGRRAARQLRRAPGDERNRRERLSHVAEAALASPPHEHLILGGAQHLRRTRGRIDELRTGVRLSLSNRVDYCPPTDG